MDITQPTTTPTGPTPGQPFTQPATVPTTPDATLNTKRISRRHQRTDTGLPHAAPVARSAVVRPSLAQIAHDPASFAAIPGADDPGLKLATCQRVIIRLRAYLDRCAITCPADGLDVAKLAESLLHLQRVARTPTAPGLGQTATSPATPAPDLSALDRV